MSESRRKARVGDPPTRRESGLAVTAACALVIALVGAWVYGTSFAGVLVLDDFDSIAGNQTIRSLWPLTTALSPPPLLSVSGRPVANLSFAVNYAVAPAGARDAFDPATSQAPDIGDRIARNLWGYHAGNLTIHLLAGLALFGVMRRTLAAGKLRVQVGAAATPLALAVALVWLVHPLQTESVTYLVQRVESLMGLFYLLTLYCAIRAWEPRRRAAWTAAAIAACALGMATKEVMVSAPLMVWLWDWTFAGSSTPAAGAWTGLEANAGNSKPGRWLLYAGLAATWAMLAALLAGNPRSLSAGFGLDGWTAWTYLITQAGVVVHYLRLAIVPSPLIFDYYWPRVDSLWSVFPQAVLLTLLVAGTVFAVVRRHPLGFAGAWFFLILAPSSSLLPIVTEIAAEHRMYLSLAGVVAAVMIGVTATARARFRTGPGMASWVAVGVVVALVATLGTLTRGRNRDYWSERALELRPDFTGARRNLAEAYAALRDDRRAVAAFERLLQVAPDDAAAVHRLAWILGTSKDDSVRDPRRAVTLAERAVELTKRQNAMFLNTLAAAYATADRLGDAVKATREALAVARAQGRADEAAGLEKQLARLEDEAGRPARDRR